MKKLLVFLLFGTAALTQAPTQSRSVSSLAVDPRDYGAPLDGVHDDGAAINTFTASHSGTILIAKTAAPGGADCFISTPIHLTKNGTMLAGVSTGGYQHGVQCKVAANTTAVIVDATCQGCAVTGIDFESQDPSFISTGPLTSSFTGADDGIQIYGGYFTLSNSSFNSFARNCVHLDGTNVNGGQPDDWSFSNVSAFNCSGSGFYWHGGDSNAGVSSRLSAVGNGGSGLEDDSQLGNTHHNPHTNSNHRDDGTAVGTLVSGSSASRRGNVVTVNVLSNPSVKAGQWVVMAGWDSSFNGTFQSVKASSGVITFNQVGANATSGRVGTLQRSSNGNIYAASTRTALDCSITSGQTKLTCPSAHFTPGQTGQRVSVAGAAAAGGILTAKMTFINDYNVSLGTSASTTVSGAKATYSGGTLGGPYATSHTAAPSVFINPYTESNQPQNCLRNIDIVIGGNLTSAWSNTSPCSLPAEVKSDGSSGLTLMNGLYIKPDANAAGNLYLAEGGSNQGTGIFFRNVRDLTQATLQYLSGSLQGIDTASGNDWLLVKPNGYTDISGVNASGALRLNPYSTGPVKFCGGNSSCGSPVASVSGVGHVNATTYGTVSNCAVNSASPAACGSAAAGAVVIPTTTTSYTIKTTAVTSHSRIQITWLSFAADLPRSPTCVAPATTLEPTVSAIADGVSFTIKLAPTAGQTCPMFTITN